VTFDQSGRRIVVSARLFALSPGLIARLRIAREEGGPDDVTAAYDAFMLDPGLGPLTYLSSDGRIVWDDDGWGVVGTRAQAFAAILVGTKKTGILELRELLPTREPQATDCAKCSATGWFDAGGQLADLEGRPFSLVCPTCAGLGWTSPSIVLSDSVLEAG